MQRVLGPGSLLALAIAAAAGCDGGGPGTDPDVTTGEVHRLEFPPLAVPAGVEDTRCVTVRLGNAEAIQVSKINTILDGASHHLVVYKSTDTVEQPEPYACSPFVDTLQPENASVPLIVSQVDQESLVFPLGVSLPLGADQMIRIEMHYLNAGDAEREVTASVEFERQPPEQYRDEASFLFVGNPDINLPEGPSTLGPVWFPIPSEMVDIHIFGMTGHTHQWGTNVEVEMRANENSEDGVAAYRYETWSWEEPPVAKFSPPLDMTAGSGFEFSCSWNNQSGGTVEFGESTQHEMCFFWSYYYPSRGHKVCLHTDRIGVPINVCCPGDAICDEVGIDDL